MKSLFQWLVLVLVLAMAVGALGGAASALFLFWLNWVTDIREDHPWLIGLLPLAGLMVGWLYYRFGKSIESGSNLILDEIHEPSNPLPLRMAPFVLVGTVITHLFGGSAGREGTAVQMGASLADQLSVPFRLGPQQRRILLMAGLSAGFGAVFGTPFAGAAFGVEVLRPHLAGEVGKSRWSIWKLRTRALLPCLIAAVAGDWVCRSLGIHHTLYLVPIADSPAFEGAALLATTFAGGVFGITGMLFVGLTHWIKRFFATAFSFPPLRPFFGGILVAAAVWISGTTKFIGLGIPTIVSAFEKPVAPWDFLAKALFTAVTLGAGFKGGEVTPLFFIGATLGNALAVYLPLALPTLAALGFVAVFAGAAKTPVSSTIMAFELFGTRIGAFAAIACGVACLISRHPGIYHLHRPSFRN